MIFILKYRFHFKSMYKAWAYYFLFREKYQYLKMYYIFTFIVCMIFFSNNYGISGRKLPLDRSFHWKRYIFDFQIFR